MTAKVFHADLWGVCKTEDKKHGKYPWLRAHNVSNTHWTELKPQSPFYLFIPRDEKLLEEYDKYPRITEIFPLNGVGMTTARDGFVIDMDKSVLLNRIRLFKNSKYSDEELHTHFQIRKKKGWSIRKAWKLLQPIRDSELDQFILPVLYRPFDVRWIFYHDAVVWRTVKRLMRHMLAGKNLGLITRRQMLPTRPCNYVFVSQLMISDGVIRSDNKGGESLFPLHLYPDINRKDDMFPNGKSRHPNLNPDFISDMQNRLGLQFVPDGSGNLKKTFGPEDVFHYIYAVFHSPTYRSRYAQFLKLDFPRVPLTSNLALFRELCTNGKELVSLHFLESPILAKPITSYPVPGDNRIEKGYPRYDETAHRVCVNPAQYFEGVLPDVWEFHIGGYPVCQKWLKDRRTRTLSYEERVHYQKIIVAIKETIRIMNEIDEIIPAFPLN